MDVRARQIRGLYGIVDLPGTGAPAGQLARALIDGGVRVLQLRMKDAPAASLLAVADELRILCRRHDVLFVVNDRVDVALIAGADGVHLGQEDLSYADARRIAPSLMIGVSTHSPSQARAAAAEGADYIGFGPIFSTVSKLRPDPVVGLEQLAAVCGAVAIPVVAIGGIDLITVEKVVRAGAAAAAIIAAVNRAPDVSAAARVAGAAFDSAAPRR